MLTIQFTVDDVGNDRFHFVFCVPFLVFLVFRCIHISIGSHLVLFFRVSIFLFFIFFVFFLSV